MDLLIPHSVEYEVSGAVSIDEIIATLQANSELLQEAGPLLQRLVPGLVIQRLSLEVRKIEVGSIREVFFATLIVAFQEDLKREVPPLKNSSDFMFQMSMTHYSQCLYSYWHSTALISSTVL